MAFLGKEYVAESAENMGEFVVAMLGEAVAEIPEEHLEALKNFKPKLTVTQEGDIYTVAISEVGDKVKETSFESGATVEDDNGKSTWTVEGDKITKVKETSSGLTITNEWEFTEEECVCTLTASSWDGTAKITFKAA